MKKVSNAKHVDTVVRKVYADALELDWEHCNQREHTEQYARWLNDPQVGGLLSQWMAPEDQRVWLKDGPMKEFARALAGEGTYALYLTDHPRSPVQLVQRAMGAGWLVVPGTSSVKPLQCDAVMGPQLVRLFWGPAKDFKHLLWAALEHGHRSPMKEARVVVFDSTTRPLSDSEKMKLSQISIRCKIPLTLVRL